MLLLLVAVLMAPAQAGARTAPAELPRGADRRAAGEPLPGSRDKAILAGGLGPRADAAAVGGTPSAGDRPWVVPAVVLSGGVLAVLVLLARYRWGRPRHRQ